MFWLNPLCHYVDIGIPPNIFTVKQEDGRVGHQIIYWVFISSIMFKCLSCSILLPIYVDHCYRPQTKLREGNIFTPVCQSFCSGAEVYTPLDTPRQTTHLDSPLGRHPSLGRHNTTPPPEMTTEAGGMHPTGMHSCFLLCPSWSLLRSWSREVCMR